MKNLFILGLLSTALFSLQAESEMLKGYKKNDFAVVCSENFNSGSNGWIIPKGFSVDNKDGILGTAALHGVCYNKKGIIPSPLYKIKVKPGATYKITLQYRVKNFQLKDKNRMSIVIGTIFYKDQTGKKKAKYFWDTKFNASESWTKYYTTIKIPNDAKENEKTFHARIAECRPVLSSGGIRNAERVQKQRIFRGLFRKLQLWLQRLGHSERLFR